jgi:hypothetical protein
MTPLEIVGDSMLLIGVLIGLYYGIRILILAFQTSVLWGLGCLLIPFFEVVYVIAYWDTAKTPFLRMLLAIPLVVVGSYLAPNNYL